MGEEIIVMDIGSTFTKVRLVDLSNAKIIAKAQSPTTVHEDVIIGVKRALEGINWKGMNGVDLLRSKTLRSFVCSSAAGGLRMVVVGLVPELTVEAGRQAALGAGAKLVGTYSYELNDEEIEKIEVSNPDLILLCGGTNGGNKEVIVTNAQKLAKSKIKAPIIVAGNKVVSKYVKQILEREGKLAVITENVLPELDRLNIEPARSVIREMFIERVIEAKGLNKVRELVSEIVMPTPMATLKAAKLLAEGTTQEEGLGELMVVEVGGATTNVHSVSDPSFCEAQTVLKGLPEPYAKRSVEGDLGIRYNAKSILELVKVEKIKSHFREINVTEQEIIEKITKLSQNTAFVPQTSVDIFLDLVLARIAVEIATERHVGFLKEVYSPAGVMWLQYGKNCKWLKSVIGTGGIFSYGRDPGFVLKGALYDENKPHILKPVRPRCFIDSDYILFGVGLLSEYEPVKALKLAKKSLKVIDV